MRTMGDIALVDMGGLLPPPGKFPAQEGGSPASTALSAVPVAVLLST